jgi:6-phosphogluconolactonase (cycloisomerase 2 family)
MTCRQNIVASCVTAGLALAGPALAGTNDILIGLDSKIVYNAQGQQNVQPGTDKLLVMDISNPAQPRIRASLDLSNSLLGPPTNLEITPNGRLGLLANSVVHTQEGNGWKVQPDDKLFVVDLGAEPPKLLDTVTVGRQPSGLDIAQDGKFALIANRAGKSVSVVAIDGTSVKHVGDVDLGQEAAGVAIAPNGKRAFAVMNLANKVAVLEIDGQKVTYDKANDIPVAFNPYNIDTTPDGKYAIASSTGAGKDNADALTTIEITGPHPHVVGLTTVGVGPEGLVISPDGKWLVTPLLRGSTSKYADYFYTKEGQAVLAAIGADGGITVKDRAPLGAIPEGVAFSPNGQFVYIGNYTDKTVQVFRIASGKLKSQGRPLALPGQPASIRGVAR